VTGHPLSSGATALSASRSAVAEHSASHFTSGTYPGAGTLLPHGTRSSRYR
jgi:hypothetical protein